MRRKLAAVGGSYLIGLIFASIFFDFAIFLICGVILLVAIAIITAILTRKYDISAALLCCAAGITVFSCVSLSISKAAEPLLDGTYDITATVAQKRVIGNDSAVFSLYTYTSDGKVGVIMYTDDIDAKKGDMLHFKARFEMLTNTAYYSTADRYRSDGITLSAIPHGDISVTNGDYPLSFIDDYREYLIGRIDDSFPDDSGALMKGIFFGDKRSFSDELYSDIRLSGVSHLTAVSGMHLTLIMTVLSALLTATRLGYSYRVRFVITAVLTVGFMAFFGFTASVLRSGIMIITANTGALFYRRSDCLNSVGLAVLLITLFDPLSCLDAGLILSAVTTVGAGVVGVSASVWLKDKLPFLNGRLCDTLCVSLCAALAGIPLSAIYFGTFSLAGIIVSVITVPLFTLCLSAMLIFSLTGGVVIPLAAIAHFCCDIMRIIFSAFAAVPFLHFSCEPFTVIITIVVISAVAAVCYLLLKKKYAVPILIVSLLCFTAVNTVLPQIPDDSIRILMHSDGANGSVVILSRDYSAAVLIGNDKKELSTIKNVLLENNKTNADTLIFCNNQNPGNELVKAAHAISENVSECDGYNDINGGLFSVTCRNDALLLSAYNTKINISSAGKAQTDMINILWGKSRYISAGTPCFLINRYQKASNGISLYFTECELHINEDGITARCNYR